MGWGGGKDGREKKLLASLDLREEKEWTQGGGEREALFEFHEGGFFFFLLTPADTPVVTPLLPSPGRTFFYGIINTDFFLRKTVW